uniref:Uncharacterized protein n=1 Tax=Megaselia scalaris TaxID=36166 RepID=T1GJV9_MEGSC
RRTLCGPISEGYEPRTIPSDYKEDHDNRRNQQVYSASPVKTVDKPNDSGMPASSLDYTMQFKTFGHPESENLNATAYPILSNAGFGHIKSKSSWHKQRYYEDDRKNFLLPCRIESTSDKKELYCSTYREIFPIIFHFKRIILSIRHLKSPIGGLTLLPSEFQLSAPGVPEPFLNSSSAISLLSISSFSGTQYILSELTLLSSFNDSLHILTTSDDICILATSSAWNTEQSSSRLITSL